MGAFAIVDFSIDFACGSITYFMLNFLRTIVYAGVTKEGIERGTDLVRK
jgi:hypothetical protein